MSADGTDAFGFCERFPASFRAKATHAIALPRLAAIFIAQS